jgi:hypothetical protein
LSRAHHIILIFALTLSTAIGSAALAEQAGRPGQVIELDELVIEGKVAKPQVFYVLGRSKLRYQGLKLKKSFIDRIVTSVRKNPF